MEEYFSIFLQIQAAVNSRAYQVAQLVEEHELGVANFQNVLSEYI